MRELLDRATTVLPILPTVIVIILFMVAIALALTPFVGNAMAGIMLKTTRKFRCGDFVSVTDHFGRVTKRGLLSTEIQTEVRDLVILPNLLLVNNPVNVTRATGTIVSAEVLLGANVPHGEIEACLVAAATDAGLKDPFVLLVALGDFSVTYRANGLLEEVSQLPSVRSRLRVAMLDRLRGAHVAIGSPDLMNQRILAPESRIAPAMKAAVPPSSAGDEVAVADVVVDEAVEDASLEQLLAGHQRTREAIADLADPPEGADPELVKRRQEQLTRHLAYLEKAIEAKRKAVDAAGGVRN